ncbi:hypothetical protein AB0B56_38620 [Streptosporangium canum]|uniref:Uncharacterized protein n=1 Tax=Streptosporangium canum TaxID=324952 RepID=A0A1I4CYZ1_9ACTN|nr:hypothetical protein [Streptosporangium canum]SFK85860.1 hypothetical protein SAMN05216275_13822 [Streptosporangium canum]
MLEIVSALLPPLVVGGAFVTGIVWLLRSEARAKASEGAEQIERDAPRE